MGNKVETFSSNIKITSIATSDQEQRFVLKREWDTKKKRAVVIGINPSKATHLKGDNTTTNAMNYLIENDYGTMIMLNLYSCRSIEPKQLDTRSKAYKDENYKHIEKECRQADVIIVAWGYEDKYKTAKKEVIHILKKYQEKVKCFEKNNKKPQHLRTFSDKYILVNFF